MTACRAKLAHRRPHADSGTAQAAVRDARDSPRAESACRRAGHSARPVRLRAAPPVARSDLPGRVHRRSDVPGTGPQPGAPSGLAGPTEAARPYQGLGDRHPARGLGQRPGVERPCSSARWPGCCPPSAPPAYLQPRPCGPCDLRPCAGTGRHRVSRRVTTSRAVLARHHLGGLAAHTSPAAYAPGHRHRSRHQSRPGAEASVCSNPVLWLARRLSVPGGAGKRLHGRLMP
jgi:hypothetical protein